MILFVVSLLACSTSSTNVLQTVCDLPTTCEGFDIATAEDKAMVIGACIEKSVEGHPAEQALFTSIAKLPASEKKAALDKAAAAQGVVTCELSGLYALGPAPVH